jgi:hypothetical protein
MKILKFYVNLNDRSITPLLMFYFIIAVFVISCDIPIEYHNPFEPNVWVLSPTDLKIDSISGTSVSLSWKNNFSITSQSQASQIQTVVVYKYFRDSSIYQVPVYLPIDTARGMTSSVTISRTFETSAGSYYSEGYSSFYVYTILGSKITEPSNFVSTSMFNGSYYPNNLTATLLSKTHCRLVWKDNLTSGFNTRIERKLSASDSFALLGQFPANTLSFVDSTLNYEGDPIYYRICAIFENGLSSPYTTGSLYVPLTAPTLNSVSTINYSSVSLSWRNNVQFGDGFIIERSEKNASFIEIGRIPASVYSYNDVSPDTTKEYIYRVKLFAGTNISDPSNLVDLGFWPIPRYVREVSGNYKTVAVSPDYSLIALTENNGEDITVITSVDLQVLAQFHDANLNVQSVDIDVSHQYLAAGYVDNTQNTGKIKIWRLSDRSLYKRWDRADPVHAVRFSPDGSLLAADGYSGPAITDFYYGEHPGSMSIIDIQKDTVIQTFSADHNIAFSPNQSFVAATTGGMFLAWSMINGSIQVGFNYDIFEGNSNVNAPAKGLKFLNDGTRFVLTTDDRVIMWDINQKYTPLHVFANITSIDCFDITPDDEFLVVSTDSRDWVVRVDGYICASSTYLSRAYHSVLCLPKGLLIKAGADGLKEYYLQKQWISPISPN